MGRFEQHAGGVEPSTGASGNLLTRRRFLATAGLCTAGLTLYSGEIARHAIEIVPITLHLANLPDTFHGLRIAQLSDIHYDNFSEPSFVRHAVDKINSVAPDVVLFTGDYVSKGPTPYALNKHHAELCAEILKEVACPVRYAIMGNHDVAVGVHAVTGALVANGIPVLANSYVPLERDGKRLWIVGLKDAGLVPGSTEGPDPDRAAPSAQTDEPILLMVHEPDYTDILLRSPLGVRTDLILAGHSHGGQICLPIMGAVYEPTWGRKYVKGLFRFPGDGRAVQLYVNRGLGTVGLPLRLNCPPEITLITLSAEPV